jgi:hypothetical protein
VGSHHEIVVCRLCAAVSDSLRFVERTASARQVRGIGAGFCQRQTKYLYVNEYFVVMPAGRDNYLIEFRGPCDALRRRNWTSDMIDIRVSARVLHADHDTLRGCAIDRIFELSEAQLKELSTLKPVLEV